MLGERLSVIAQNGVLLPLPLRIQGAEGVTIDLARATVSGGPSVAALPLVTFHIECEK